MRAVLADIDGADTFWREASAVRRVEPFSEKSQVAPVGDEGVGALARPREVLLKASQDLFQRYFGILVSPLVWLCHRLRVPI